VSLSYEFNLFSIVFTLYLIILYLYNLILSYEFISFVLAVCRFRELRETNRSALKISLATPAFTHER